MIRGSPFLKESLCPAESQLFPTLSPCTHRSLPCARKQPNRTRLLPPSSVQSSGRDQGRDQSPAWCPMGAGAAESRQAGWGTGKGPVGTLLSSLFPAPLQELKACVLLAGTLVAFSQMGSGPQLAPSCHQEPAATSDPLTSPSPALPSCPQCFPAPLANKTLTSAAPWSLASVS